MQNFLGDRVRCSSVQCVSRATFIPTPEPVAHSYLRGEILAVLETEDDAVLDELANRGYGTNSQQVTNQLCVGNGCR